jgi:PAS domain S-box-containing protein
LTRILKTLEADQGGARKEENEMKPGAILVVDDTPASLAMLTHTLAAEGYEVRPADSGKLALTSVFRRKPDLILLDIRMPLMDGYEVCRRLKARRQTRDIPVIFLSALNESEERVKGLKLGAVDFVSKPCQKEELKARIATHLELSRLRLRLAETVAARTAKLTGANERLQRELAERARAEQALRESEIRFRTMADHAPVVVWTSGPDDKMDFCNRYALTFTGRRLEELLGDRWKEVVHPQDLQRHGPPRTSAPASHRDYRAEYRARRADGEYRWMLDTATPRFLPNGAFAGYVGIAVDVTDLKQNQEQLAATQKLESLGVLVAGVAHNFNNMLATVLTEVDLALADIPAGSEVHACLQRIDRVAVRAAAIVALLMAYAQPGSGGAPATPVHVGHVVEEVVQLFRATISKRAALSLDSGRDLPCIRADISQIRQVILNLLSNAWEALPNREGSIRVTTSCVSVSQGAGNAAGLPPGNYVRLEVADTGCGMTREVQSRIFEPFYSTKSLGRGLGLAAVQGIVRSLGGVINARSTPRQGSIFEILFPCLDSGWDAMPSSAG